MTGPGKMLGHGRKLLELRLDHGFIEEAVALLYIRPRLISTPDPTATICFFWNYIAKVHLYRQSTSLKASFDVGIFYKPVSHPHHGPAQALPGKMQLIENTLESRFHRSISVTRHSSCQGIAKSGFTGVVGSRGSR